MMKATSSLNRMIFFNYWRNIPLIWRPIQNVTATDMMHFQVQSALLTFSPARSTKQQIKLRYAVFSNFSGATTDITTNFKLPRQIMEHRGEQRGAVGWDYIAFLPTMQ